MLEILDMSNKKDCEDTHALWGGRAFDVWGKWEDEACVFVDGEDGGWTAPVKGAYFFWNAIGCDEDDEDYDFCGGNVMGCLVGDGPYPTFAGMCNPIFESDYLSYDTKEEAIEGAKDLAKEIFGDIARGESHYWGLDECDVETGELSTENSEKIIVSDDCNFAKKHYDALKEINKD